MPEAKLYWDDIQEGQEVPTFQRETDLMNWNRFAAVNDEFLYIHMDDEAGKAANQPGVFGMGNVRWAYMHNMLNLWIGDSGFIRKLDTQYRVLNLKGDMLTAKGTVTKKYVENGEHLLDLDVWVENQRGENTCPGHATVELPSK
jgi:acyl dehydratase